MGYEETKKRKEAAEKMGIAQIEEKISTLELEKAPLEAAREKCMQLSFEIGELKSILYEKKKDRDYHVLALKVKFEEPEYPGIGYHGVHGSAIFEDQETASQFIAAARAYFKYKWVKAVGWNGAGHYTAIPNYERSHYSEDYKDSLTFVKTPGDGGTVTDF